MDSIASQITSLTIVYSAVYSGADQRKHQSSASLAFVRGIHRGPANSPHKWPVTRKMFPFDDVIMMVCHFSRVVEYVDHLHEHFLDPVVIKNGHYMPVMVSYLSYSLAIQSSVCLTVWYKTKFGSQNFGYQIWFRTRLLNWLSIAAKANKPSNPNILLYVKRIHLGAVPPFQYSFQLRGKCFHLMTSLYETKYHMNSLMSKFWFRWWIGAARQQAVTWANVGIVLCHHITRPQTVITSDTGSKVEFAGITRSLQWLLTVNTNMFLFFLNSLAR